MEIHAGEYADVVRPLNPDEVSALHASLDEHGQRSPILVDERGVIIDGHHRVMWLTERGIEPRYEVADDLSDEDKRKIAVSLNVDRRQMTQAEKREAVAMLLKIAPERSDRQVAADVGVSPSTVGAVRAERELTGELSNLDSRVGADGKERPVTTRAHKREPAVLVGNVIAQLAGTLAALDHIDVAAAVASVNGEREEWDKSLTLAIQSLSSLRKRLRANA